MALTAEQQEIRRHRITASDMAAIMGLNKYRNAIDVFLEKTGQVDPFQGNEFTHWGMKLESVIADEYAERMQVSLEPSDTLIHPRYDWLAATPDRVVVAPSQYGLECKNKSVYSAWQWGTTGTDEVPDDVAMQCHANMEVTGFERWDAAVLLGGNQLGIYTLEYDHELAEAMVEMAHDFWHNNVLKGIVPPLDGTESSVNYLNRKWSTHGGLILTATPEITDTTEQLRQIRAEIKEKETEKKRLENLVKDAIGEAAGVELADGKKVTWTASKARKKVNWLGVAEELAQLAPEKYDEILAKHTEEVEVARTFRMPRNW